MKVRKATENDEGPWLSGLIICDHTVYDDRVRGGGTVYCTGNCPICNGTGFRTIPVVMVPDPIGEFEPAADFS